MAVLLARGEATVAQVLEEIPDLPTYNAARSILRVLETKGHARHERHHGCYVYMPTASPEAVRASWLDHLLQAVFGGSAPTLVNTLIEHGMVSDAELDHVEQLVRRARQATREGQ